MNIFNYTGKEFDKKLDEIFKNKNKEELKQELIQCGLKVGVEMEEDIKVLEKYINGKDMMKETLVQAIENLIKEYKELEEKNKKWEELYDEDQEYITQLNNKIFQLETDNKKLDKENQGLFEAYNFNDTNLFAKTLKEYRKEILNSIPKSKVREKIEALDDIESEYSKKILNISKETATFTIFVQEILKQLLQEGDK